MDHEVDHNESIMLRELSDRLEQLLSERGITDPAEAETLADELLDDIVRDIVHDDSIVPVKTKEMISRELTEWEAARKAADQKVQADTEAVFHEQFAMFDRCIAFSQLVTRRLEKIIVKNARSLLAKQPRPVPDVVTGAMLRCLLLLAFHNKICMIADEILCLMRRSFPNAADSRLRTLHENVVVLVLVMNDHTYEVSERYQDHAVFEELGRLKAYRANFKEVVYRKDPIAQRKLEEDIAAAEKDAQEARARWGPSIAEQYGWARPGLPAAIQGNRRIMFVDLERASGADFLRGDYLTGNNSVHAGAYSTINQLNISGSIKSFIRPADYRDDHWTALIGSRAARHLGHATGMASKGITTATEEYDEFLVACEMARAADATSASFTERADRVEELESSSSPSP